jgi:uncharacterized Zn-binding protein involved in type VI secretion
MPIHHIEDDSVVQSVQADFTYNGSTTVVLGDVPNGATVLESRVVVSTLFNDVGATIQLGTSGDPDELFNTAAVDITSPGHTEVVHGTVLTSAKSYQLTLAPAAATQGAGRVITTFIRQP